MSLQYTLRENKITKDIPDDYVGVPHAVTIHTREEMILAMTGSGSILKPTESNAVIDAYWSQIADWIGEGEGYADEYISVRFSIGGVFVTIDDRFDTARHSLNVITSLKQQMLSRGLDVTLQYIKADDRSPEIESVYDWGSDTENKQITSGQALEIKGEYLKIHDNTEEEGVFFVSQSGGTEIKAERIRINQPQTLSLMAPTLEAGDYRIEIRNTAYKTKTLRTGITGVVFTVG
ncbi:MULTISPECIES: DUF4469 domain-containing protein [Reichenbachiella]|uniref:DNA-binding domain-containing protein n=1 Tax=Reichenbachiella agariperforans TaxID=156994 RepID=A0A1M6RI45_REIAG|nr:MULTISPECIES: DUF4469 domain-containing protein [Reichenbachiella]RJE70536.1 hypothetical protein BGP76_10640 [Reichenbachiella sp. MSK19-1]SHK32100.1 DNA-binding domain-containing protein [Reichenbachiella agariperforans]